MPSSLYSPIDYRLTKRHAILVPFKLISKSNFKPRHAYLAPVYRNFENALAMLARNECGAKKYETGWIVLEPHFPNRKHADLNNLPKSLFDALKKGAVLKDDRDWALTVLPATYDKQPSVIEIWTP